MDRHEPGCRLSNYARSAGRFHLTHDLAEDVVVHALVHLLAYLPDWETRAHRLRLHASAARDLAPLSLARTGYPVASNRG